MYGNPPSQESTAAIKEKIEAIPRAMRNMGWNVSAALMERWIRSPAWRLPPNWKGHLAPDPQSMALPHLDQEIVRMNWAMNYYRIRSAVEKLRGKMANEPAKKAIRAYLAAHKWTTGEHTVFGSRHLKAVALENRFQSNFETFGDSWDTMDDLYGSLGQGTLKVALVGEAKRSNGLSLQVTNIGFYIRDTYDFNEFQYLGIWTRNGALNKAQMLANSALDGTIFAQHGEPVGNLFNHDFEAYRHATGCGGDFVIYSDVYWETADFTIDLS